MSNETYWIDEWKKRRLKRWMPREEWEQMTNFDWSRTSPFYPPGLASDADLREFFVKQFGKEEARKVELERGKKLK